MMRSITDVDVVTARLNGVDVLCFKIFFSPFFAISFLHIYLHISGTRPSVETVFFFITWILIAEHVERISISGDQIGLLLWLTFYFIAIPHCLWFSCSIPINKWIENDDETFFFFEEQKKGNDSIKSVALWIIQWPCTGGLEINDMIDSSSNRPKTSPFSKRRGRALRFHILRE